jgi:hypothetical protein
MVLVSVFMLSSSKTGKISGDFHVRAGTFLAFEFSEIATSAFPVCWGKMVGLGRE